MMRVQELMINAGRVIGKAGWYPVFPSSIMKLLCALWLMCTGFRGRRVR